MSFLKFHLSFLIAWIGLGSTAVKAQEPLTLQQAIRQALALSPEAAIARADVADATAAASLARTNLLPQLQFTEDLSRGDDPVYAFGSRLRQHAFTQPDFAIKALNQPPPIGNFSTRLSASWVAFDSLKTQKEIHRADQTKEKTASAAKAVDQLIVLHVITAYQSILLAEREIDVARHEQESATAILDAVADRVKAGLALDSDRMSALVNVAGRKEELITAEGELDLAWAELREAMGTPGLAASALKPIEVHDFPDPPLEKEIAVASSSRPDLRAAIQAQSAQNSSLNAAKAEFGPRVSAYGTLQEDRGSPTNSGGTNWIAGIQISMDILPAGKRAHLAHETALKQRIDAQLAASQQHIRLEISQALIHRRIAKLSMETARDTMNQAAESLRILKNRYTAGLATMTDVLQADDAERNSQSNYWRSVYRNAAAYAESLFATGKLTPDTAEELQ